MDRLLHDAHALILEGDSYRRYASASSPWFFHIDGHFFDPKRQRTPDLPLLLQLKQIVSSHVRVSFNSRKSTSSHVAKRAQFKENCTVTVFNRAHSKEIWKMQGSQLLQLNQDRTLGVHGSFS